MKLFFKANDDPALIDPYSGLVTAQAIEMLFRNLPGVAASTVVMPMIMVWVMWGKISHGLLVTWCLAVIAIAVWRVLLSRVYFRRNPAQAEAKRWGRYYTVTSLCSGLVWAVAPMFFYVPDSALHQVFLFTSVVGVAAGSTILNAYWIEGFYAVTLPLLLSASLRMVYEGGADNLGIASIYVFGLFLVNQIAKNLRSSILSSIRLRFENLDLVERLREEKNKAETASRDKTRFLASASHDLRQPVHALTLFADALEPRIQDELGKSLLGNMGRSIDVLNQLLESLLDISKLDANIIKPNYEHFYLKPMLESLHAEYLPQAKLKKLASNLKVDDDMVVYSDKVLLGTMLRNLISNAIKYTHEGHVEIVCRHSDRELSIEIRDSGIGIAPEQHREIFREFYQLTNPERDRSKGLGLGLAIVDRLSALMNHRITLQSQPGKGSVFAITLPVGNPDKVSLPETLNPFMGHRDVEGMRVLVLDDEKAVLEGMHAVLTGWGCEVILADSEQDAMEKMKDTPQPHLIIADYRLREGKNGAQAIEHLRQVYSNAIPALIITGDTSPDRLQEAHESGHTLMHKPVQPAKLRTFLRRVQRRKA